MRSAETDRENHRLCSLIIFHIIFKLSVQTETPEKAKKFKALINPTRNAIANMKFIDYATNPLTSTVKFTWN